MALFANCADLKVHRDRPTPKLASCNFVASAKSTEALAQSGHLALSASSQIVGRFQHLKTLHHPNLCEYVEITQGKHDRLFVVTEYFDNSLQKARLGTEPNSIAQLRHWAYEILSALAYLQENQVVHAALAPSNILLDENENVKLCGYGLYYMTGQGVDVDFPIGYPCYLAPECLSDAFENPIGYDKRDIWALGVILAEQYARNSFWTTSDLALIFESLSTLSEWAAEKKIEDTWQHQGVESLDISKEILAFLQNGATAKDGEEQKDLEAFRQFILSCLCIDANERPDIHSLLSSPFLSSEPRKTNMWNRGPILVSDSLDPDDYDANKQSKNQATEDEKDPLKSLPISHIYELWRLAGGDVELNLIKRGVFLSMPVIERLPRACFVTDGTDIGADVTDTTQLYTDKHHILGYKELYERLEEGRSSERFEWDTDYFKVVDENDVNFLLDDSDSEDNGMSSEQQGEIEDFCFAEPSPTLNGFPSAAPTPTTPSTSRSINKTFSLTNMSRSRSSSSLSVSSPTPTTPTTPAQPTVPKLPLFLREQDVTYQYHRQLLFAELLRQYPASRKEIIHHAKADIPPLLRGKIWAAILGVYGDVQAEYDRIDKVTPAASDRQIEVDVPRCHQYNQLLASSAGHAKLRRILKSWVAANEGKLVYWQGLDSLCAPFLTLNFNDEALAFACLQKFLAKYLNNFFRQDNAPVLQEYLAIFRHLLSFHDPELSSHLDMIGFVPNLYAIPWFLTLFTHVFSLDKIYHLWDKFLVGPASLPLFAGISILRQIRSTLLSCEFNDCIVLFSESFPKVDIEKCIQSAMAMCKVTPPSIVVRRHINTPTASPIPTYWWEKPLPLEDKKHEIAPRISVHDLGRVSPYALILDIRSDQEFSRGHISSSMNVQASQLPSYGTILKKLNRKYHIVVSNDEALGPTYAGELVQRHFSRVALLQGGVEAVQVHDNRRWCTCRPQKQTTAGHKGKGSEPPFVIWKCKVPTPLSKK